GQHDSEGSELTSERERPERAVGGPDVRLDAEASIEVAEEVADADDVERSADHGDLPHASPEEERERPRRVLRGRSCRRLDDQLDVTPAGPGLEHLFGLARPAPRRPTRKDDGARRPCLPQLGRELEQADTPFA